MFHHPEDIVLTSRSRDHFLMFWSQALHLNLKLFLQRHLSKPVRSPRKHPSHLQARCHCSRRVQALLLGRRRRHLLHLRSEPRRRNLKRLRLNPRLRRRMVCRVACKHLHHLEYQRNLLQRPSPKPPYKRRHPRSTTQMDLRRRSVQLRLLKAPRCPLKIVRPAQQLPKLIQSSRTIHEEASCLLQNQSTISLYWAKSESSRLSPSRAASPCQRRRWTISSFSTWKSKVCL